MNIGLLSYQIVVIVEFIKIVSINLLLPLCLIGSVVVILVNLYDFAISRFVNVSTNNFAKPKEMIKSGAYAPKNKNKKSRRF
jgi:hypothetical protein